LEDIISNDMKELKGDWIGNQELLIEKAGELDVWRNGFDS